MDGDDDDDDEEEEAEEEVCPFISSLRVCAPRVLQLPPAATALCYMLGFAASWTHILNTISLHPEYFGYGEGLGLFRGLIKP